MRRLLSLLTATAIGAVSAPLSAQQLTSPAPSTQTQATPPATRVQALTIQPISIMVGLYSAEFERAISHSSTLGFGASYLDGFVGSNDPLDPTYLSLDAKLRYYPGEQPLRGFAFGLSGGYTSVTSHECSYDIAFNCVSRSNHTTGGPSVGVQLDYNWLLGRKENFVVALGVGAKRLFAKDSYNDLTLAYPTGRVSVGFAF